jgi:prepilin-type N-terminal cleavage/methylation domain-containing protein
MRPSAQSPRRGFSLVEILIVVAVIAILAGLVVPRVGGLKRREESLAVDRVADLLTMFAFRTSAGMQPVGLLHDAEAGRIELLILDIDPSQADMPVVWQPDRLSMPVLLPEGLEIVSASEDLASLPRGDWMIASKPGGDRPRIELRLEGDGVEVDIVLEPHDLAARRSDRSQLRRREPRDLDEEGLDRDQW